MDTNESTRDLIDYDMATESRREAERESPGARDLYNQIIQGDGVMSDSGGNLGPARPDAEALMVAAFSEFGRWCLEYMRDPAPGDIDGGDAQDEAIRLGLLVEVEVAEPCGENCNCAEYHGGDGFPARCLRNGFNAGPQRPEAVSGESHEVPKP